MKITLIGLGNMGFPIAQNLLQAGHELVIYNRTYEKAAPLIAQGARFAQTPMEAAGESEIVLTMLSDDAAVEQVVFGSQGILLGMPKEGIHISASTISVEMARKLSEAHEGKEQYFISSTVLGRPDAAKDAKLRIILAGPEVARERALPLLKALGEEIFVVGNKGEQSNVVKLGINFLLASVLEALSEAQVMIEKYNIDPVQFMNVVNSHFLSPVYQNYGNLIVERRFEPAGFKMMLGLKDVELAISAAQSVSASLPLGELIQRHFTEGIVRGYGNLDWTALIKCVEGRDVNVRISDHRNEKRISRN